MRRTLSAAVFLAMGSLIWGGCGVSVGSIKSCAVWEYHEINGEPEKSELLASQIPELNRWFAALDSDWTFKIADQPREGLVLRLTDGKGRLQSVELRGNTLWTRDSFKVLTGGEFAALGQILAPEYRLPDFR